LKKILIVKDEAELALNIKEILIHLGHEVSGILNNGREVLEFLNQNIVDLIFMDIQISGTIDGLDLC